MKTITFLAVTLLLSPVLSASANEPPTSLEQIDARIQEIESLMIQAQADRFRAKHRLEYADETAAPIYQEAKAKEKEILDTRRAYDNRLRVIDAGLRATEKEIARLNQEANEHSQLAAAIGRELAAAEGRDDEAGAAQTEVLNEELRLADQQVADLRAQAKARVAEWTQQKAEVAARDPEASALQKRLEAQEATYRETFGHLHENLNAHPDVQELDRRRQAVVAELQGLRERRAEMLRALETQDRN